MRLCTDCKFYKASHDELGDICLHPESLHGGVRSVSNFSCFAMRAGICHDGCLFEPSVAYGEHLRDKMIDWREETGRGIAEAHARFDFERDQGARE
jgi:hypothetical protein